MKKRKPVPIEAAPTGAPRPSRYALIAREPSGTYDVPLAWSDDLSAIRSEAKRHGPHVYAVLVIVDHGEA